MGRPIPFELSKEVRDTKSIGIITYSLDANARRAPLEEGLIYCKAYTQKSKTGRLKGLYIVDISNLPFEDKY